METFGEEHRKLRLKYTDFTLREFAKKLTVSPAYVSNVENGLEPPFSEEISQKSVRLMRLSAQEEARLFALREEGAKTSKVEKLAFQVARRTQHLSNQEFNDLIRRAKKIIEKQKGHGGKV
jgi:transcriptional regulator with XRE-family HTH domain